MDPVLAEIERKVDAGIPLSIEDGLALFRTHDLHTLGRMARAAERAQERRRKSSTSSTAISTRRTSVTQTASSVRLRPTSSKKPERVLRMTADQVFAKAIETGTNFNQIHIVGGHDPRQLSLDYWLPLMRRFKEALAARAALALHRGRDRIHGQTPPHDLSRHRSPRSKKPGSTTSTAARRRFLPKKRAQRSARTKSSENWLAIHEELHRQGVASNATMLYGHIESLEDRVDHLIRLRESQERSPGFQRVYSARVSSRRQRTLDCGWTTGLDDIRMFAVARLMLDNFDHIKAYWMIQGLKVCQVALQFGADDMDGTHGSTDEEMIYHSAGTQSGQYVDDREFRRLIEEAGYVPVRRNSTYEEFPFDWTPPAADESRSGDGLSDDACVAGASAIRTICRSTRRSTPGAIEYPGHAARRRAGASQRDAASAASSI